MAADDKKDDAATTAAAEAKAAKKDAPRLFASLSKITQVFYVEGTKFVVDYGETVELKPSSVSKLGFLVPWTEAIGNDIIAEKEAMRAAEIAKANAGRR